MLEVKITMHDGPRSVVVECPIPLSADTLPSQREIAIINAMTAVTTSAVKLATPHAGGTDA